MRYAILPLLIFLTFGANAKNFYVSSAGSNSNDGLTERTPWQTISKVNSSFSIIAAGDSILFRKGDVFYGALVVGKSGSSGRPIVIGAYGTATAKPLITGFVTISSWTSAGSGIYQAAVPAAKSTLNLVTINGIPHAMGRYPNADAANGGFLTYESFSGYTSITDNQLTSAINWTGAEAVIKKNIWMIDRCKITNHSGTTITYTSPTTYAGSAGYGYFIQNDARTLDQYGEWFLNKSSKQFQMYFGTVSPSSVSVKVSTIDTLLAIVTKSYITVRDIAFEGANANTIFTLNSNNISVYNCDVKCAGESGIMSMNTSNFLADGISTNYTLNNGIFSLSGKVQNVTIRNCDIKNVGMLPGMGLNAGNSYKGLRAEATNTLIEYNRLDSIGYSGIEFQGTDVMVRNNVVNHYDCTKQDGGGIYTYGSGTLASPGPTYYRRTVKDNIVMNAVGAPYGTRSGNIDVAGLFFDGRTMNVEITGNTVFNVPGNGVQFNNPVGMTLRNNTIYNSSFDVAIVKWAWGDIKNLNIKSNTFFTKNLEQRQIQYVNSALNDPVTTTIEAALKSIGSVDSNYYSNVNPIGFATEVYASTGGASVPASAKSMTAWSTFTGFDANSKNVAKLPVTYKLNSLVGSNKFANSALTSNITGLTLYGSNVTAVWDNSGKISGGSLKMSFSSPTPWRYGMLHSPIGAVSSSKKYIFRVTTLGTTPYGIIRAYIRKTASPYTSLTPIQIKSFGAQKTTHEFLFDGPTTDAGGSFVIEIEQNSGTTYIDNIEFYEANATTYDFDSQVRLEYNDTKSSKTVSLGANYRGVDGTLYPGTITLKPFTSAILVQDTGTVVVPPTTDPTPLTARSSGGSVSCYGGTTSATVSATGGKSPYTGTGSFTVSAGKGSVALSAKTPAAGKFTAVYYPVGPVSASKNYILRFSTTRNNGSAVVNASIRQSNSPWATITPRQTVTIGTARVDHEYYFAAPPTNAAASFQIEVEQTAGITYIDNIAFFEANSSKQITSDNLYAYGQFETDISHVYAYSGATPNHTIAWDNTGKISSIYYYPVKDAAGAVTVAQVKTSQPAAALKATATVASAITVASPTTTLTVAASGGTAPYTGIGNFRVGVGTYSFKVTDTNGCAALANLTLTLSAGKTITTTTTTADPAARSTAGRALTGDIVLTASPNPSSNYFTLFVQGGTAEKIAITVYNADGRVFYQTTGNSNANYTFGNNFTQGIYIVKVVQGSSVQTLKLVKSI